MLEWFSVDNLFGFVGLLIFAASWQMSHSSSILRLSAVSFLFFSVDLFLKGAITGSFMIAAGAFNAIVGSTIHVREPPKAVLIVLVTGPLLPAALAVDHAVDVLPMMAHVTGSIAFFSLTVWRLRALAPIGTVLWAAHNAFVGAYWQMLADILILTSMAIGAWRNRN